MNYGCKTIIQKNRFIAEPPQNPHRIPTESPQNPHRIFISFLQINVEIFWWNRAK